MTMLGSPPTGLGRLKEAVVDSEQSRYDRSALLKRAVAGGAGLTLPALAGAGEALGATNYPDHPKWKFVFVNHVTTNPFFVPTQYGAADACALVDCAYQWTGATDGAVGTMIN